MSAEDRIAGFLVVAAFLFTCTVTLVLTGGLGAILSLPSTVIGALTSSATANAPGTQDQAGLPSPEATDTIRPTRTPFPSRTPFPTLTQVPAASSTGAMGAATVTEPTETPTETPSPTLEPTEPAAPEGGASLEPADAVTETDTITAELPLSQTEIAPTEPFTATEPITSSDTTTDTLPGTDTGEPGNETPVSVSLTVVTAEGQSLNLRTGPSLEAEVIGGLPSGTVVEVLARSADSQWAQVQVPETGEQGWVSVSEDLVTVDGDLESVPVAP